MASKIQHISATSGEAIRPAKDTSRGSPSAMRNGKAMLFGEFCLVPSSRILTQRGRPIPLGSRAHDILVALVERAGRVVGKAELFSIVWPNTSIDESVLRVHIAKLRKTLGDGQSGARLIVNVSGRGYVFVADVERISG
jgi:DNA-binding winged helix-turn-helix (wHTH) protein